MPRPPDDPRGVRIAEVRACASLRVYLFFVRVLLVDAGEKECDCIRWRLKSRGGSEDLLLPVS